MKNTKEINIKMMADTLCSEFKTKEEREQLLLALKGVSFALMRRGKALNDKMVAIRRFQERMAL